jgi:23S rRNA (cytidine2498-2'-O)-methyltransferase
MTSTAVYPFGFVSCQRGAEFAVKQEVFASGFGLRLAFSRSGFVTFKIPADLGVDRFLQHKWVFARTHGLSLGKVQGNQLHELAARLWQLPTVVAQNEIGAFQDIHVWEPDAEIPGQNSFEPGISPLAVTIEEALRQKAPGKLGQQRVTVPGTTGPPTGRNQRVLDVVAVEPGQWWISWHRAELPQQQWPGGIVLVQSPPQAVSRAYLKMEEALRWSAFPFQAGDEWVELGCSPGGSCQALLDHGQFVTGIDPAEVDPLLLGLPNFRHLRKRTVDVRRSEFRDVDWLAADMNVVPNYTLDTVEAIVTHRQVSIRGLIVTLKFPDWKLAAKLPEYLSRIHSWGYRDLRARQLAHNAREVCIVALRSRALRRFHHP